MRHCVNNSLPKGDYRIKCEKCGRVFDQGQGNLTQGALASMKFSEVCDACHGEVILETNPE